MTPEIVLEIGRNSLLVMLWLATPLLACALVIGLVIGIFQAATQINEMTLSFIPKLIGMAAALVLAGPWMLKLLINYTANLFNSIPTLVR
ncbi:MAG: flagellar biosynthesis protein FliQ [Steroidobacteraceae bacterium]